MSQPQVALLVSTYQRPAHLRRALASIELQAGVEGLMEVVVTDDGSTDETAQVVVDFANRSRFRVQFTTHPHQTFQLARCRNEGVRASTAPYLLFLDGDCVLPPHYVRTHLDRRRPKQAMSGECVRLDEATSSRVTLETIRTGEFVGWTPPRKVRRLRKLAWKSQLYGWLRHPSKPKLLGGTAGIWRSDYQRVNGYDENFEGWGCEDDDMRRRLHQVGVQTRSILRWTYTYHLWHPSDTTAPNDWKKGANVAYLLRADRAPRCVNGLEKPSGRAAA